MRKLITTVLVMSAMMSSFAYADDSSSNAESLKLQAQWGMDKANFNDGDKSKVVDLVDSIFREDGLAENGSPKAGQIDQSSVRTQH